MPRLTILSDRQKGIVDGVEANFPTAFHGFCMRHLSHSFRKEFNTHCLSTFSGKLLMLLQLLNLKPKYWRLRRPHKMLLIGFVAFHLVSGLQLILRGLVLDI
ncbi:hypothetical protein NE237_012503 [Protea cynaroides]|uniref:MULE transposase domain-containing protein n=1 Tax=Protea cynaroides TaxID=273540 RepID=A0A9Q0H094_9MAGN|nr:hypothetical protein NE237_012503 [Protea cynaroides]